MSINETICPVGDGLQFGKYKLQYKFFSVEVDRTFLKMCAKNLVKVTRIAEVMSRNGPPTLRNLSFQFRY